MSSKRSSFLFFTAGVDPRLAGYKDYRTVLLPAFTVFLTLRSRLVTAREMPNSRLSQGGNTKKKLIPSAVATPP